MNYRSPLACWLLSRPEVRTTEQAERLLAFWDRWGVERPETIEDSEFPFHLRAAERMRRGQRNQEQR